MKIKTLPNIKVYSGCVKELSPSTFSRIRSGCSFPVVINQMVKDKGLDWSLLLPNLSKAAHLGTIIHKLFEERVKGDIPDEDEYERRWDYYVEQEEKKIRENYPSLSGISFSDYDKLYESCESTMTVESVSQTDPSLILGDNVRTLEARVTLPGYIYGTVDRLIFHHDGIEIIDYKSGKVYDENGNIKDSIICQLNLYAICCEHQYGKRVKKLTVIQTSDVSSIDIPIERANFQDILKEIEGLLHKINTAIKSKRFEDLQKPSVESCGMCNCRHLCKGYLESGIRSESILDGIVIDCSNKNYLKLQDCNGNTFTVNKLADLSIENWNDLFGKHLIFINVSNRIEDVYKRTSRTILFQMSE